jgi:7-keto-8-aminopelargonate synthetase-like enzyme
MLYIYVHVYIYVYICIYKCIHVNLHPGTPYLGSTGSRLLSGNSQAYVETEKYLADFHGKHMYIYM